MLYVAFDDQFGAWGAWTYFDYLIVDFPTMNGIEGNEVDIFYGLVSDVVVWSNFEDMSNK